MANYEGVQDPDGTTFGKSGGKVGFFGTAPTSKATGFTAPVATASSTSAYGFTQAQADALITWVRAIDAELKAKGLIGS